MESSSNRTSKTTRKKRQRKPSAAVVAAAPMDRGKLSAPPKNLGDGDDLSRLVGIAATGQAPYRPGTGQAQGPAPTKSELPRPLTDTTGGKQPATHNPQLTTDNSQPARGNPKSEIQNRKSGAPLRRAINLLPYQQRWVQDDAKLKIAVKARQIGYSFAATLRAVFKCLEYKTTWIFLSKGERQSRLLMEKVQDHIRTCGIVARASESTYFEGTSLKQLEVRFPNGSVIYGLPANPDTARGYTGHVTLDEFAFHADADKIYAALFPTITRGYGIEVISTPNGTQGKFYELAKAAGLTEQGLVIRDQ